MGDDKRAKQRAGLGSVVPRGAKFRATVMIAGERYSWTVDTPEEGDAKIADARRRHAQGRRVKVRPESVAAFMARYLAWAEARAAVGRIAASTYTRYERDVRLYIVPRLGKLQVAKLTRADVESMMHALERRGLSPRAVVMARNTLRQALNWAIDNDEEVRNVAAHAEAPVQTPRAAVVLTSAQRDALLATVAGHRYYAVYVLALALGLREGEILGLRWQDIDLTARTLGITYQVLNDHGKAVHAPVTKTPGSAATLPIPPFVAEALRHHRTRQTEERLRAQRWENPDLVFPTTVGTPTHPRNFYRHFEAVRRQLAKAEQERAARERDQAYDWGALHFHDLRGSAASFLAAMGVPLAHVQRILRHQSSRTTERYYVHLSHEDVRAALDAMGDVLDPAKRATQDRS